MSPVFQQPVNATAPARPLGAGEKGNQDSTPSVPPASYFVHRGAALFRRSHEWCSAQVDAQGVIDWANAEPLGMADLFEFSEVLESVAIAMAASDQI